MPLSDGKRRAKTLLEEGLVYFDSIRGEQADADSRFGIEEAHAKQALTVIFHLHQRTVGDWGGEAEDRAVVEPRMASEEAVGFAGPNKDGRKCGHVFVDSVAGRCGLPLG